MEELKNFWDSVKQFQASQDEIVIGTIAQSYEELLAYALHDYTTNRNVVQNMIGIMEKETPLFIMIQLRRFAEKYKVWKQNVSIETNPEYWKEYTEARIIDENDFDAIIQKLAIQPNSEIGIDEIPDSSIQRLSTEERKSLFSTELNIMQENGRKMASSKEGLLTLHFILPFMYGIGKNDGLLTLTYVEVFNLMFLMDTEGHHQPARDLAETLLMVGFKDGNVSLAMIGAMRLYTDQHNIVAALLYANLCIERLGTKLYAQIPYELYWNIAKLQRELRMPFDIFETLWDDVEKLPVSEIQKDCVFHTILSAKLVCKDPNFITLITDFFDRNRERIIGNANHSAVPWFSLLMNYEGVYEKPLPQSLSVYCTLFDSIIPPSARNSLMVRVLKGENLYELLKECLVKNSQTRNQTDLGIDNKTLAIIARRLMSNAFATKSREKFLMAMSVLSDITFVARDIPLPVKEIRRKVDIVEYDKNQHVSVYAVADNLSQILGQQKNDCCIWIGYDYQKVYCYQLRNEEESFFEVHLEYSEMRKSREAISGLLLFSTTNGIYPKGKLEYEDECKKIKQCLNGISLPVNSKETNRMLIVKGIKYSFFPHQLLINKVSGNFIAEEMPIANIISTEQQWSCEDSEMLTTNFTKAFWCPLNCEHGRHDMSLQTLYSKIGGTLDKYEVIKDLGFLPHTPLSAELNIVCAHGADNIRDTNIFYVNHNPIMDIGKIDNGGKLLLLFVCHSGTMDANFFDTTIHTLIKYYLRKGYQSVIAPMWSLSVDIVDVWLDTFMKEMIGGKLVIDSCYKANMAIKTMYETPSAWACLHLFGNPYLRMGISV